MQHARCGTVPLWITSPRARVRRLGYVYAMSKSKAPAELTPMQLCCLRAIHALTRRLGRSPSTREVSAEMGLSPAGSRFHIENLARYGLITRPEMVLVMHITDAGKKYL